MNERVSKNYLRSEMACGCGCGFDSVDSQTLVIMEECREFVGEEIIPSSVSRCVKHNKAEGGAEKSLHLLSRAADLPVRNPEKLYKWLCDKYPTKYGFILYNTFVHIDTRTGRPYRKDNRRKSPAPTR